MHFSLNDSFNVLLHFLRKLAEQYINALCAIIMFSSLLIFFGYNNASRIGALKCSANDVAGSFLLFPRRIHVYYTQCLPLVRWIFQVM